MTDAANHPELRDVLRRRLVELGLRQRDFARQVGSSEQSVSRWLTEDPAERVVPKAEACERIAAVLGLDPDYVLMLAGHRAPRPGDQLLAPELAGLIKLLQIGWERTPADQRPVKEGVIRALFPEAVNGGKAVGGGGLDHSHGSKFAKADYGAQTECAEGRELLALAS